MQDKYRGHVPPRPMPTRAAHADQTAPRMQADDQLLAAVAGLRETLPPPPAPEKFDAFVVALSGLLEGVPSDLVSALQSNLFGLFTSLCVLEKTAAPGARPGVFGIVGTFPWVDELGAAAARAVKRDSDVFHGEPLA